VLEALGFFVLAEVVGLAALPLAGLAFGRLPGAGLGFSKPLGLLLLTWLVWMAGSVGIAHYATATILVAAALMALAGGLVAGRESVLRSRLSQPAGTGWWARRRAAALAARALPADPERRRIWIASEEIGRAHV